MIILIIIIIIIIIIKKYKRRLPLVLKTKLNGKNKITAINAWAVAVIRYGAGILQWKESELKDVDRKSKKTMTMYEALQPKSDVGRLYTKRKEGCLCLCLGILYFDLAWNSSIYKYGLIKAK